MAPGAGRPGTLQQRQAHPGGGNELEVGGRDMHYSNAKIYRELGFSPRVLPEEGLARTIEWLKSVDLSTIKTR
jgi:nucleoside-diphosphate-sugar epimerase